MLQVTSREGLRMLDQLVFVTGICEEDRRALFSVKERMEIISIIKEVLKEKEALFSL